MAYDEALAERVRGALAGRDVVREQAMFGGLAFMVSGHMTVGVIGHRLMVRLGDAGSEAALREPDVSPTDFTGRPMKTMVYVEPAGTTDDAALARWVSLAAGYTATLPPKRPGR
jgi:TfoX/Sxy family transcriptional regulator of competence genes